MATVKEWREQYKAGLIVVGDDVYGVRVAITAPDDCDTDGFARLAYLYMRAIADVVREVERIGMDCLCGEGDGPDEYVGVIRAMVDAAHAE